MSSLGHPYSYYAGSFGYGRSPLAASSGFGDSSSGRSNTGDYHNYLNKETPRRYFNLGLIGCCLAGFVFMLGLFLMVWGSSPFEPEAIWISGIFFLFLGGFMFFIGIGSIGLYLTREDARKREIEQMRSHHYAASIISARSLKSRANIYLID